MIVKQVYVQYTKWEDFTNGMWRSVPKDDEPEYLQKSIEFTGDHIIYGNAMKEVVNIWENTMLNSLTNVYINRRAFLGHCAVSYKINCPEYITRMAWKHLTDNQRFLADKVAQQTIDNWIKEYNEKQNKRLHKNMGEQMLLKWNT